MQPSVEELQRAWHAVERGDFREPASDRPPDRHDVRWSAPGPTLVVVGSTRNTGSTTTALAVAEGAEGAVRLVECGPMHSSGLAAATTAELGVSSAGWRRGERGDVRIERTAREVLSPSEVPLPGASDRSVTVIDVGWEAELLVSSRGWLTHLSSHRHLLVGRTTGPGLRFLERALDTVSPDHLPWVAAIGLPLKKWPRYLRLAVGHRLSAVIDERQFITVPEVRALRQHGVGAEPLPPSITASLQGVCGLLAVS